MKIKIYLRGLGIGIVVTALLMGYADGRQRTAVMTDEQIMARAKELGMVREDQVLLSVSQNAKEETPMDSPEPVDASDAKPVEGDTADDASGAEPADASGNVDTAETKSADSANAGNTEEVKESSEKKTEGTQTDATVQTEKPVSGDSGMFTLEIAKGSGSEKVSALLEKGGFVDSAGEFDRYLCKYGYDNKIVAGVHQIPKEADYETIAKIITSR